MTEDQDRINEHINALQEALSNVSKTQAKLDGAKEIIRELFLLLLDSAKSKGALMATMLSDFENNETISRTNYLPTLRSAVDEQFILHKKIEEIISKVNRI